MGKAAQLGRRSRRSNEESLESFLLDGFAEQFFAPPAPQVLVKFGSATHTGLIRSNNEDHFLISKRSRCQEVVVSNIHGSTLPPSFDEDYLILVADGVGGREFGEEASRRVLQILWNLSSQATSWVMKVAELDTQELERRVGAYVDRIEAHLGELALDNPELIGAGTTLTGAHLMGRDVALVNIGDSRAYLCRDGTCRQITRDHTLGQSMIDSGESHENIDRFNRILLSCFAIGRQSTAVPELHYERLADGDRLLLCTDGLSDMVPHHEIEEIVHRLPDVQEAADALVEAALDHGGKDNVTVALAGIEPGAARES